MSTNEGCFIIPGWGTVEPVLPELVYDDQSRSYSFWEPTRRQLDFQTELHLRKAFISGRWDANRNSEADIQILIFRQSGFIIDRDTIAEDWEDLRAEIEGCLYVSRGTELPAIESDRSAKSSARSRATSSPACITRTSGWWRAGTG